MLCQKAPYPQVLADLVAKLKCFPNWEFELRDCSGDDGTESLQLVITLHTVNSRTEGDFSVANYFVVPAAVYNEKTWRRWIFECCRQVFDHELAEFFMVGDERPFAPLHGPGNNPYYVRELSTEQEVRTDQRGNIE